MQMHRDEISCNVAAKAHGVVLMDRAGWHGTDKLKVPKNLTIRRDSLAILGACWPHIFAKWREW
jgi:hypothetical protein